MRRALVERRRQKLIDGGRLVDGGDGGGAVDDQRQQIDADFGVEPAAARSRHRRHLLGQSVMTSLCTDEHSSCS